MISRYERYVNPNSYVIGVGIGLLRVIVLSYGDQLMTTRKVSLV